MSNTSLKRGAGLAVASLTAAVMSLSAMPAAAELSYTDISGNTDFARDRPRVDKDSDGNYHIVYRMGDAGGEIDSSMTGSNVGYMMVDRNGNVLIDEVKLTTDGTSNINTTDVEVTSDNKVIVSFSFRGSDMQLIKLDPSLAAQDGTAPALGTITDVAAVTLTGSFDHPFIELDDSDNVYVWSHDGTFAKSSSALVEIIAPMTPLTGPDRNGHSTNPMALDSDGNVHLVFQDDDSFLNTISYAMLDGTDGSVMIDATNIITMPLTTDEGSDPTPDEAPHAVHYSIMADSNDRMALVWADKRNAPVWDDWCEACASGGTLHYAKIDPSLDDQSGDAADMTVIKTVDDVELGPFKYAQAFMASNGSVHIFHGARGGMSHIRVSSGGGATNSTVLTSNAVTFNGWNKHYPAAMAEDGRLFWSRVDGADDGAGGMIVMGKVSTGKKSSGGGTTAPALLVLALGAAALRRRAAR